MFISRWADKQVVETTCNEKLLYNKKNELSIYVTSMMEFQNSYAEWKKPDRKYMLDVLLYKILGNAK